MPSRRTTRSCCLSTDTDRKKHLFAGTPVASSCFTNGNKSLNWIGVNVRGHVMAVSPVGMCRMPTVGRISGTDRSRRRKVRCDEKRPVCNYCYRLCLDCAWQQDVGPRMDPRARKAHVRQQQHGHDEQITPTIGTRKEISLSSATYPPEPSQEDTADDNVSFSRMFNYASFMWDKHGSPSWGTLDLSPSQDLIPWSDASHSALSQPKLPYTNLTLSTTTLSEVPQVVSPSGSTHLPFGWSEPQLAEYFARSAAPPILATVETSAHWLWMRKELTSMTLSSRMVKSGVMAFVAMELESVGSLEPASHTKYYHAAKEELEDSLSKINQDCRISTSQLRQILAVLFLLSYIDLLTMDVSKAHANLREGFNALQMVDIGSLGVTEKRLLSWLRLLDARAVSAGGEGLFLTEDDSAINTDLKSPESSISEVDSGLDDAEATLEDFIMRPAYIFFQKVQLFMGRVSKIDPWHRRRGTVEDETEVMIIAATISRDIKSLWQQRPTLMDHAVTGRLGTLLPSSLADTITRTMRVYHANYYASFIHLHRVAYKNLPRTTDVTDALQEIRQVTRLVQQTSLPLSPPDIADVNAPNTALSAVPPLPVNMLWPLLMIGVETDDAGERAWVLSCVKGMEHVASNAGMTHDVLQEVIRRQDETKSRVDIRKVMHDIFDRAFAIV
ncbi:hypothetical protein N7478_009847 [Penicillium angulare]|uniref:uncharacterized protein n=1 Tax=Penicillium angulare TaxID=116970 RepID=UPI00253FD070|nr:uncharacterized protein N7478_009847 [Penicillium angulare]KAJ5267039.1 hypothetical protein N7478_009847 [Penicillium angulare]